jgi:hypothetical protein
MSGVFARAPASHPSQAATLSAAGMAPARQDAAVYALSLEQLQ